MSSLRIVFGAALLALVLIAFAEDQRTKASEKKLFLISYEPQIQPVSINRIHNWVVHVETADGAVVDSATISLIGGMPDHDHGLPTLPQSTRYLGDGDYLVEGVKFHMNGRWEVTMTITVDGGSDTVTFDLQL
jgi:hypothetical protein